MRTQFSIFTVLFIVFVAVFSVDAAVSAELSEDVWTTQEEVIMLRLEIVEVEIAIRKEALDEMKERISSLKERISSGSIRMSELESLRRELRSTEREYERLSNEIAELERRREIYRQRVRSLTDWSYQRGFLLLSVSFLDMDDLEGSVLEMGFRFNRTTNIFFSFAGMEERRRNWWSEDTDYHLLFGYIGADHEFFTQESLGIGIGGMYVFLNEKFAPFAFLKLESRKGDKGNGYFLRGRIGGDIRELSLGVTF